MSKRRLIFYLLLVFLIDVSFVMAYHGGSKISGATITPLRAILILIVGLIIFGLIIWFFRKASMNMEKKRK